MGKRPAEGELFEGNMGSIQREIRSSMRREEKPAERGNPLSAILPVLSQSHAYYVGFKILIPPF
jgi:hypothetical protein